jgi:hypothetical protein
LSNFAPGFIFDAVASLTARRFLSSNITLAQMSAFYSSVLEEHYPGNTIAGEIELCAEAFLRTLSEVGAENSDEILKSFEFIRLTTTDNTAPRKLKSMFSSALDGKNIKEFSPEDTRKRFKAFLFLLRSKPVYMVKADWDWSKLQDGDWLSGLDAKEIDPFSFL